MENDVLDTLEDLGYQGSIASTDESFSTALEAGAKSQDFTQLVEWATTELSKFYGIEEHVNAISDPEDCDTFLMELSGFLRTYGCPYTGLSDGPISQRLATKQNRLHLLDFLLSELSAARMLALNKPHLITRSMEVEEQTVETDSAKYMKQMLIALGFPKPPDGITSFQLFSKVESKIKELTGKLTANHVSKPLLKARLSQKQWDGVCFINQALAQEYECRREMLLKRLDVTIQSFRWSDKAKSQENKLAEAYQPIRRTLHTKPDIGMPHLLAAREDLLNTEKITSGTTRDKTKCKINKVMIGRVPDRGGRAWDHEPPPPEMPSWQKRDNNPQQQRQHGGRGGGRGSRGGGDRGGRNDDRGGGNQQQYS